MPSLLIRNLDESLHARIKQRARANRRSMDAEAQAMLRRADVLDDANAPQESLYDIARRIFGPARGVDLEIPPRGSSPSREPPDFSAPEFDRTTASDVGL
jgi:plasmid stability protein